MGNREDRFINLISLLEDIPNPRLIELKEKEDLIAAQALDGLRVIDYGRSVYVQRFLGNFEDEENKV